MWSLVRGTDMAAGSARGRGLGGSGRVVHSVWLVFLTGGGGGRRCWCWCWWWRWREGSFCASCLWRTQQRMGAFRENYLKCSPPHPSLFFFSFFLQNSLQWDVCALNKVRLHFFFPLFLSSLISSNLTGWLTSDFHNGSFWLFRWCF